MEVSDLKRRIKLKELFSLLLFVLICMIVISYFLTPLQHISFFDYFLFSFNFPELFFLRAVPIFVGLSFLISVVSYSLSKVFLFFIAMFFKSSLSDGVLIWASYILASGLSLFVGFMYFSPMF